MTEYQVQNQEAGILSEIIRTRIMVSLDRQGSSKPVDKVTSDVFVTDSSFQKTEGAGEVTLIRVWHLLSHSLMQKFSMQPQAEDQEGTRQNYFTRAEARRECQSQEESKT